MFSMPRMCECIDFSLYNSFNSVFHRLIVTCKKIEVNFLARQAVPSHVWIMLAHVLVKQMIVVDNFDYQLLQFHLLLNNNNNLMFIREARSFTERLEFFEFSQIFLPL